MGDVALGVPGVGVGALKIYGLSVNQRAVERTHSS